MGGLSGEGVMKVEWMLLGLSWILVATRMIMRLLNQQKHLLASDALLITSAIFALALVVTDTMTYRLGGMDADTQLTDSTLIKLAKIAFAGNYFYDTCIYFPKFSILALYARVIPHTMPRLRVVLWIVSGFVTVSSLITCLADTFWCGLNVASNWSLEEGTCNAFDSAPLFHLDWSLNFLSDVFIFALPFPLLLNLTLKTRQLYGLIGTFTLGIITITINVVRFVCIFHSLNINSIYIWSMAEMSVSIMVACLPALRHLLRRAGEFSSDHSSNGRNGITNVLDSAFSRTKFRISTLGSRYHNGSQVGGGKSRERMERLSDGGDSEVELTNQSNTGILKSHEISVQSIQITPTDTLDQEFDRQIGYPGLGNKTQAWHAGDEP